MNKQYGLLDRFRLVAAFFVICIHTSPLSSVNAEADFFLTRVLARIAVPFFFMVTGQFILSPLVSSNQETSGDADALCRRKAVHRFHGQLIRLCLLYAVSILFYLPLGIYAGHYRGISLIDALRMLLFDGTFYHLWYFPACILGMLMIYTLSRHLYLPMITVCSALLYLIGLLGDSYFGLTERVAVLRHLYDTMFRLFSYTRNGLFFAPIFLVLGIWCDKHFTSECTDSDVKAGSRRRYAACFLLCFFAMTIEAFLLHYFQMQRHDSMYLFLIPVIFFLYRYLVSVSVAPSGMLRRLSTLIYLLHPMMIVCIRGVAKIVHLTSLFVENSVIHFLTVALLSALSGLFLLRIWDIMEKLYRRHDSRSAMKRDNNHSFATLRAWIELDKSALEKNVRFLQSRISDHCRLMPAVKANAYGHGAVLIAKELNRLGIRDFCVACASEGVELRKAGIQGQILILGYTDPSQLTVLKHYRLTQTVLDTTYANLLEQSGLKLHVHIAVDTGMHRLGIPCENTEAIASVYGMQNLAVDGIYTHLAVCDSLLQEHRDFTLEQINRFFQATNKLKQLGVSCTGLHLLSSYGIINYAGIPGNYVRPGIALYGVLSSGSDNDFLHPVLTLKARVTSVRMLSAGESAGYGRDFIAKEDTVIAILSIGYADGLPRTLSNGKGAVLINGERAPIIGRICMDQTLIDVSRIADVHPGDTAVLIGQSGSLQITAAQVAEQCDTITNELLSRLGTRLERIIC